MQLRSFRRSAAAAVAALGALTVTAVSGPAGAEEDFILGSGQVEAQMISVGPSAGRLSFAPIIGLAFANYQNTVARAESRNVEYAALNDEIPPELRDAAPSLRVDSTDDGAAGGLARAKPEGSPVGASRQEVRATDQPLAEAIYSAADLALVPGVLELSGGRVVSRAGIVDGTTREATGTVSLGRITLGGGAAVLQGVTWTVSQRTGADEEASGSFRIEGMTIGGQRFEPPPAGPTAEQWKQLNDALMPLGLHVSPPEVEVNRGIATITPLGIRLTANEVARTVGPPLLEAVQPVREPITGAILEQSPEAAAALTVGDLALGALVGSGSIDLRLGGSTAFTEGEAFDDPFGGFDLGGASPVHLGDVGPSTFDPGGATGAADGGGSASGERVELAGSRRQAGTTGGPMAVVGLLGLLAVGAMAAADWWRMRHEPRRIAFR